MPTVHLVSRPAAGGIKTHLEGLLGDLPPLGWIPVLHAPRNLIDQLGAERNAFDTFELKVPASLAPDDLTCAHTLARQITPFDLVHAHGIRAAWICLLAKRFVPFRLITTLHNVPPRGFASRTVLSLIKSQSERVICVSEYIAADVQGQSTVVIPNGVTINASAPDKNKRELLPQVAVGAFIALTAARLSYEKGIDLLIEAAKLAPEIQFVVAGDGPLRESLQTDSPANVLFLGRIDNVRQMMQAANCVIIPSRSEGQGIVALEAFAAGVPVIASNVGGLPESIVDRKTGFLIAPANPNEIATTANMIKQDPATARTMADNAYVWVTKHRRRQSQSAAVAAIYCEGSSNA